MKTKFVISIITTIIVATWVASCNVFALDVSIDLQGFQTPISPYIYGTNDNIFLISPYVPQISKPTFVRSGGDEWTPYNWENNATNNGIWYGPNSSIGIDNGFTRNSDSDTPGDAAIKRITAAHKFGAPALITVPITDYVAADKNGIVTEIASDTSTRWVQNKETKPTPLLMIPNTSDKVVYEDEFVNFLQETFKDALAKGKKIFYSLGNEPGIWSETHNLLHPAKTTYAEMADRTERFGRMIKHIAPNSLVFGPVAYGFNEFVNLQDAPDSMGRDYLDFYLDTAKNLEASERKRIIDVLDIHWYPAVRVEGKEIIKASPQDIRDTQNANPSKAEIEARVQAPRSLWDPTYIEDSWIAKDFYGTPTPIQLIPWLKEKIAAHYPGTKLAITEYNYGDGIHISHAIAQADVLGIFGREGLFAANFLPLADASLNSYITGAFDMYLNYDGKGSAVGDLSLMVKNPDVERISIYAMKSSKDKNVLYIVAINKTDTELPLNVTLTGGGYKRATPYRLTSANLRPKATDSISITDNILSDRLPPLSITTLLASTLIDIPPASSSSGGTNTTSTPSFTSQEEALQNVQDNLQNASELNNQALQKLDQGDYPSASSIIDSIGTSLNSIRSIIEIDPVLEQLRKDKPNEMSKIDRILKRSIIEYKKASSVINHITTIGNKSKVDQRLLSKLVKAAAKFLGLQSQRLQNLSTGVTAVREEINMVDHSE